MKDQKCEAIKVEDDSAWKDFYWPQGGRKSSPGPKTGRGPETGGETKSGGSTSYCSLLCFSISVMLLAVFLALILLPTPTEEW